MYIRMAIHRPRPDKADLFLDSIRRFKAAQTGLPDLVNAFALADEKKERLVGIAIWESKEHFERGIDMAREAIKNDPHDEWEDNPPEMFELEEA
ncbi:MAG: hypothetical protein IIA91_07925 [Chloroflexi bacterium]|nr:hypothetical protein [Chloroflexota bacterium]